MKIVSNIVKLWIIDLAKILTWKEEETISNNQQFSIGRLKNTVNIWFKYTVHLLDFCCQNDTYLMRSLSIVRQKKALACACQCT